MSRSKHEWAMKTALALLLAFIFSGPVRATLSTNMVTSYWVAFTGTILLMWSWRPQIKLPSKNFWLCFCLPFTLLTVFAIWKLYNPHLYGFPTVGGGDAGNHVKFENAFSAFDPKVYKGFVSLYSLVFWLKTLFKLDDFEAYRLVFYSLILFLNTFVVGAFYSISKDVLNFKSKTLVTAVFVGASLVVFNTIVLPLLHYFQADGFFSQLFGLVPILSTVFVFAFCCTTSVTRIVTLMVGLVLFRFTYGLNLGDLFFTSAVLIYSESKQNTLARFKLAFKVLATCCFVVSIACYTMIFPLLSTYGAFARQLLGYEVVSLYLLALVLLFAANKLKENPSTITSEIRYYEFVGWFGVASASAITLGVLSSPSEYYYLHKYSFYALLLVPTAVVVLFATSCARFVFDSKIRKFSLSRIAVVSALVLAASIPSLFKSHKSKILTYRERVHGAPPFQGVLQPLVDQNAKQFISNTLAQRKKEFGGFLVASWPMANFMNAIFGRGEESIYENGTLQMSTGNCVFWKSGAAEQRRIELANRPGWNAVYINLESTDSKKCSQYQEPAFGNVPQTICALCF